MLPPFLAPPHPHTFPTPYHAAAMCARPISTRYLSAEASEALMPFLTPAGRGRRLPAGPNLPTSGEKLPSWMLRQMDRVRDVRAGAGAGERVLVCCMCALE